MFGKVVILSQLKIPHLKVNSLLLVSNEILDSHFVPEIHTLRRHFTCSINYQNPLRNSRIVGILPILTLR